MAIIQEHGQGTHIVLVSSRSGKWTVPFPSYHKFLLTWDKSKMKRRENSKSLFSKIKIFTWIVASTTLPQKHVLLVLHHICRFPLSRANARLGKMLAWKYIIERHFC